MHVNMTFDDSSYIKTRQNVHITLLFVEYFDNKNVLVSKKMSKCSVLKRSLSVDCGFNTQLT